MLKIIILLLLFTSQIIQAEDVIEGSGNIMTESRQINDFTKLTLNMPATIRVDNQAASFLSIMADDNIIPIIKSDLKNNHLTITTTQSFKTKNTIEIILGTKQLQQLNLESSTQVTLNKLQGDKLMIDVKGISTIIANGNLTHLNINLSGSHKLNFQALKSQMVSLNTKGSNIVNINAQQSLDIKVKGISTIRYSGNPKSITKQVLGISNIKEME
jgi:hypothetical protein